MRTQESISQTMSGARFGALMLSAILLLAAFSAPAAAGNLDLGVGLGLIAVDEKDWQRDADEDRRADLRVGYFFTDRFELEAQLILATPEQIFDDSFHRALMLNGLFYFMPGAKTRPYALLGVGSVEMDGPGTGWWNCGPDDESFGYQAGFGVRYYPSNERFSIRVEVSVLGEDTFDERSLHPNVAAGVAWRFGD